MRDHSKSKGTLGEVAVSKDLLQRGYDVFADLGDLSRVDLVVLVGDVPIKVQVKAKTSKAGTVGIDSRKAGPNYRFRYRETDVDVFAVYVLDHDLIFYVSAKEILHNASSTIFRISPSHKKGNGKALRWVKDYQDFKCALRDYTPSTLPA